jgi:superfamily II DNA or RNA helicase
VVARLGRTTAVLVHKEFLMNQWAERVMECYDIDESEIGFVQQGVCDYEGKKIVMIMVQSLLAREYPEELFKYFGMTVVDEAHRFGAVEFRKAITMFPGRYRLGITATPRRADGLERVFFWHIGNIAAVGAKRRLKPRIEMVRTNVKPSDLEFRRMKDFRGELTMNKVLDWLVTSEERNRLIVQLLLKAARSGRKVLLLSGRREHLNVLRHMTKSEMAKSGKQFSTGLYVGGMTDEQRSVSAEKQIIFGTYNMAAEGLDIPELDTLFLATPKGDIEQSVGRILRTADGKKEPVVVDFVDHSIGLCIGLSKKRLKQYQELGYVK